jgi:hypothetical protein
MFSQLWFVELGKERVQGLIREADLERQLRELPCRQRANWRRGLFHAGTVLVQVGQWLQARSTASTVWQPGLN